MKKQNLLSIILVATGFSVFGQTENYIPKYNSTPPNIDNSIIYQYSGNIGIGTTSPSARLHVSQAGLLSNFNTVLKLSNTLPGTRPIPGTIQQNTGTTNIDFIVNKLGYSTLGTIAQIGAYRSFDDLNIPYKIHFSLMDSGNTNLNEIMTICNTGKVGIGTSTPLAGLHIYTGNSDLIAKFTSANAQLDFKSSSTSASLVSSRSGRGLELATYSYPNQLYLSSNGNVGIGTTTATSKLFISSTIASIATFTNTAGGAKVEFYGSSASATIRNTINNKALVLSTRSSAGSENYNQLYLSPEGKVGINKSNPTTSLEIYQGILKLSGPSFLGQDGGARLVIDTEASTAHYFILCKNNNGKQFFVNNNGVVYAKEINVVTSSGFPDYVFEEDYNLRSLNEVEAFIKENKHLPNIPSAATVEENGFNLGEMNKLLLEKIEELTLYTIEQQKLINQLTEEVKSIKKSLK